jgi:ubiquinone/menaquinone biosynthesis C-methylase UbiE
VEEMDKWNAADYNRNSQNQYRWGMELIRQSRVKPGEKVLDLGCGDGKITAVIASIAGKWNVTGVDASKKMIKFAKSNFPDGIEFIAEKGENIDFLREFDLIFSNACLHWIADQDRVIKGVYRALKPGGRIFFQMGGKGNAGVMNMIVDDMIKKREWSKYFKNFVPPYHFHSAAGYRKFLKTAGLKPVKIVLMPKMAKHDAGSGLAGWMRTTWFPYTNKIPLKLRDKFISQAVDSFIKSTRQCRKKEIDMKMIRLQVEAVKPFNNKDD